MSNNKSNILQVVAPKRILSGSSNMVMHTPDSTEVTSFLSISEVKALFRIPLEEIPLYLTSSDLCAISEEILIQRLKE
jgi:hypothetical protein